MRNFSPSSATSKLRAVEESLSKLTHEVNAKIIDLTSIVENPISSRTLMLAANERLETWKKVRKLMHMLYLNRDPQ